MREWGILYKTPPSLPSGGITPSKSCSSNSITAEIIKIINMESVNVMKFGEAKNGKNFILVTVAVGDFEITKIAWLNDKADVSKYQAGMDVEVPTSALKGLP